MSHVLNSRQELENVLRRARLMTIAETIVALREPQRKLIVLLQNRSHSMKADEDFEAALDDLSEDELEWGMF